MVNHYLVRVIAIIFMTISYQLWAAEPVASVDRSVISIEDTLTLTIRINDTGGYGNPDTTPLEENFQVLGTSQSSRHSYINGRSESSTEWTISLIPKHTGELQIPPIEVDGSKTQSLTINVQRAVPHSANSAEPIFLESEVSSEQVYTQQQLIYTVRVFQSIQLDNMSLSDIDIDNALIEKLSQNSFQRRIGNRPYRVHEIRYAIFPQQSGSLTIPEVVFSANEITSQRSFFSLPGQGRPIRRMTQQHEITVLPPPASFPQTAQNPWLPADNIQLTEEWSADPDQVRVGDSITRTITVNARGLLGSQLPPQSFTQIDGTHLYPDQGKAENTLTEQGVSSVRTDSVAIIPTKAGSLQLPKITLKWWDTHEKTLREATIPARTITVSPAPAGSLGNSQPLAIDHSTDVETTPATVTRESDANWIWQSLTAFFAGLWLITLWLWWRSSVREKATVDKQETDSAQSEKQLFKQLLAACQSRDPNAIRNAVITWAQRWSPDSGVTSLYDVQALFNNDRLTQLLTKLDNQLYGTGNDKETLASDELASLIKSLRIRRGDHADTSHATTLPPLYTQ